MPAARAASEPERRRQRGGPDPVQGRDRRVDAAAVGLDHQAVAARLADLARRHAELLGEPEQALELVGGAADQRTRLQRPRGIANERR